MRISNLILCAALYLALCSIPASGRQGHTQPPNPETSAEDEHQYHEHEMDAAPAETQQTVPAHAGMQHSMNAATNAAAGFLMRQASGTGVNPGSAPQEMWMRRYGSGNVMLHGSLFLNEMQQTGPRGGDKFFSTNWIMGMVERSVGASSVMIRVMASLDPLTVTKRRYPLLFQTGELAFGEPIVDGQHPHDLVMEAAVQFAHPLSENTMFNAYFAPVGDPALGPVAFPHRISAEALPQAVLGHHLQDATHIALEVVTVGLTHRGLRLEASGFHGTEPDENRWNIDYGAIDSWSARVSLTPHNAGSRKHPWDGSRSRRRWSRRRWSRATLCARRRRSPTTNLSQPASGLVVSSGAAITRPTINGI